jgi:hypothetical protein
VSSRKPLEVPLTGKSNISRRGFIHGVGTGALGTAVLEEAAFAEPQSASNIFVGPGAVPLALTVNGKQR